MAQCIETTTHIYTKIIEEIYLYRKPYITTILILIIFRGKKILMYNMYITSKLVVPQSSVLHDDGYCKEEKIL